jgi:hypothetical protein
VRQRTRAFVDEVHSEKIASIPFRQKQYEHGLAWVHLPEDCGGLGLSPKMNSIVFDEITKYSKVVHLDPPASIIGIKKKGGNPGPEGSVSKLAQATPPRSPRRWSSR